ncbi:MAG: hypothetical protein ABI760_04520 [Ferruginibacter sp.]
MDINIFLASSFDLKEDRNKFQLYLTQLNEVWSKRGISFKLEIWEYFIDSMSINGLQEEYNKVAGECDIFLMLFFTKVGKYTAQEFETALKQAQLNKKPRIYTYFKEALISTSQIDKEIVTMLEFKEKLTELKHYPTVYNSFEDLQWKFSLQLEKIYGNNNNSLNSIKSKSQIDKLVIESVCILLSPQSDENTINDINQNLNTLINKASVFAKNAVYQLAKVNRRSNRTTERDLMERSIPIFNALIDSNTRKNLHYYYGQLAYALKDQNNPDWKMAEENFDTAIAIRGSYEPEYYYEFNRAICKVHLSKQSGTTCRELILEDLRYAKQGMGNQFEKLREDNENRELFDWLNFNEINL